MPEHLSPVSCLVVALVGAATLVAQRPPTYSETRKLVREYYELDATAEPGQQRRVEILARVALLGDLRDRHEAQWRKDTLTANLKYGRKLGGEAENFWWAEQRRGRYLVGGETEEPQGLLIALHGGGVGSGDAGSAHGSYAPAAKQLGWLCISPEVIEKTELGWTDAGTEEFVLELVDAALRSHPKLDPGRVYLAGHSMGGYGSWTLGAHHADRWAALAPSAGAPTPILERGTERVIDLVEGVIPNLRNTRMVVFQSTDDPRVPPGPNQFAVQRLREAAERWGGFAGCEYWEVGDRGHGFPAGGIIKLLERVQEARREAVPTRIVWQPDVTWKRQLHWLRWERPRRHAILVADLDREANTIRITCEGGAEGLSVLLDERVVDLGREVVVELNGEEVARGAVERRPEVLLLSGAHPDPALQFSARLVVTD